MSGFIGMFHTDGAPVDAERLKALTESLRFRGPDGSKTWCQGSVGFGHTLFATTTAQRKHQQPECLDNTLWVTGDIRLDARAELIAALDSAGQGGALASSDAGLILRAYRAWGPDCVKRLMGDFAFALWDGSKHQLFCARDPFGVKPFYYAQFPDFVVFTNTLKVLRQHPRVGARFDEFAIADFLMFGYSEDTHATAFADIRRLPGGHCLTLMRGSMRIHQYYELPAGPYLRYARADQYVDHFKELITAAVADRSGDGPVAVEMSGGLDSPVIAAALTGKMGAWRAPAAVQGVCYGWNAFFPDPEPALASDSARSLGLPLEILEQAGCAPFSGAVDENQEPSGNFYQSSTIRRLRKLAAIAPVVINGQGSDEVFYRELLLDEVNATRNPRLALDALRTWLTFRRPPIGLQQTLRRLSHTEKPPAYFALPVWLNPDWCRRLNLDERVRATNQKWSTTPRISRASARVRLTSALWQQECEGLDAGSTGVLLETRLPYLDQRIVRFALSLPPFPWCVDKYLLRQTLSACLPAHIRHRPKTPLQGEPVIAYMLENPGWHRSWKGAADGLPAWIDAAHWLKACAEFRPSVDPMDAALSLLRVVALARWLSGHAGADAISSLAS